MTTTVKTPLEMFYRWEQETPGKVFLRQPKSLEWREYSWREVADQVRRLASFLRSKNYPQGTRIAREFDGASGRPGAMGADRVTALGTRQAAATGLHIPHATERRWCPAGRAHRPLQPPLSDVRSAS